MNQQILENIEDVYPLSPVQRGILFHTLGGAGDQMYFFQVVLTMSGDIDVDIFRRACQNLIDRHAILRTAFVWKGLPQPLQVVHRRATLELEARDLRSIDPAQWEQQKKEFLRSDRERGLSLAHAPLMRLTALRMPQGTFTFVWSFHHLIVDAWSQSLLLRELFQQYDALRSGTTLLLEAPAGFRSYIEWLSGKGSADEAFWRQSLAGAEASCELRIRSVPGEASPSMQEQVHRQLSVEASDILRHFDRSHRVTLNTLVQAAWTVLMAKYSGSSEIIFGSTVAVRPPELDGSEFMIGPMINIIPIRMKLMPQERVGEFLARLQRLGGEVLDHAALPLASIRQWAGDGVSPDLFESIIVFENAPFDLALASRIKEVCSAWEVNEPVNYPFALKVLPFERIAFTLAYKTSRCSQAFAEGMLSHLELLLEQISGSADQPVDGLRLEKGPRGTGICLTDPAVFKTAGALFTTTCRKYPNSAAIETGGRQVTYSAVEDLITSFAQQLKTAGVAPEVNVAVCLPRGWRQVCAALAIWRAGGVYAPLDINGPVERLLDQLLNVESGIILCRDVDSERLASAGRLMVVECPDMVSSAQMRAVDERSGSAGVHNNDVSNNHDVLSGAYLIHTSGSTGRPKGVLVSHRGLASMSREQVARLEVGPGSRVLQFASPSFDASIFEIALALFSGATLVQAPEGELLLGPALLDFMERAAITHAVLTPSLLASLPEADLPALRVLVVAGEACPPEVGRHWGKGRRLFNAYGPTEATIWSTVAEIRPGYPVTIGRPIAGVETHIVDLHGQISPPEIVGELLLGGETLARGYLKAPEISAERFIPDYLGGASGGRLYRTGDLACSTRNGDIEFCGRVDQQIKLRGYRIELEEIEAVLAQHPDVSSSAVVQVREANSAALAAFVVLRERSNADAAALKSWLARKLPDYSVPGRIHVVSELPLTQSGKVDRESLTQSAATATRVRAQAELSTSPIHALLLRYWEEITGLKNIDSGESLFEQGGDSLRLMELLARIIPAFEVEIPIEQLFNSPTIKALIAYLLENSDSAGDLTVKAQTLLDGVAAPVAALHESENNGPTSSPSL